MKHKNALTAGTEIEIRFSDCDPLGIVWHGNYFKYFEDGREAFSEKHGFDFMHFYNQGYITPLVNVHVDFKKPLRYKDVAHIETIFRNTEAAKIIFDYVIRLGSKDGEVMCKGSTTQVFVHKDSMNLSLLLPDFIIDWKKSLGLQ